MPVAVVMPVAVSIVAVGVVGIMIAVDVDKPSEVIVSVESSAVLVETLNGVVEENSVVSITVSKVIEIVVVIKETVEAFGSID